MKGTELFVKALQKEGIDYLFAYPGGYAIDIFDELYKQDSIQVILPRHEQGLVHAADGYARATGRTGVCLVTSGPGATNLVTGIATANYDSVPLVCFTGQVPTSLIGNDAFQEVDIVGITRSICKYAVTVRKREDLGRIIKEAFYIANTGKKGPVVVDLPKDIMLEEGDDLYPKEVKIRSYKPSKGVHIGQLKKANSLLSQAKKPLFLMGGGVNISGANEEAKKLAELTQVPVITTIMGKGALPTNHELYIGNVGMHGCYAANHAISECDLLFSIGTRFNDRITGKIDEFYGYCFGKLEYRTVRFEEEIHECCNYQGNAVVNYTERDIPYTRIIEHKHFEMFGNAVNACPKTVISKEYSTEWKEGMEPYYPVNDERNMLLAEKYRQLAETEKNVIFGGRLAEYKYYDMGPVVEKVFRIINSN